MRKSYSRKTFSQKNNKNQCSTNFNTKILEHCTNLKINNTYKVDTVVWERERQRWHPRMMWWIPESRWMDRGRVGLQSSPYLKSKTTTMELTRNDGKCWWLTSHIKQEEIVVLYKWSSIAQMLWPTLMKGEILIFNVTVSHTTKENHKLIDGWGKQRQTTCNFWWFLKF